MTPLHRLLHRLSFGGIGVSTVLLGGVDVETMAEACSQGLVIISGSRYVLTAEGELELERLNLRDLTPPSPRPDWSPCRVDSTSPGRGVGIMKLGWRDG